MAATPPNTTPALVVIPQWAKDCLEGIAIALPSLEALFGVQSLTGAAKASPTSSGASLLTQIGNLVPKLPVDLPTAAVDAFAEVASATSAVVNAVDSPAMQAGRLNAAVQAFRDRIAADANAALQPGASIDNVDKDLS